MPPDGVPPDSGPSDGVHDLEARLTEIVGVIQELAALRFDARATVSTAGDIVDAVAAGVNALGEELAASYEEIEQRVADRTAELARMTAELRRRALQDALTGLANRPAFWDRLTHRLDTAARRGTGFAVLFIDLDGFKAVNDTLGHAAGDLLLVEVARRITAELRTGDTTARVGGDEFLVLLDEVPSAKAAMAVAERVAASLEAPHEIGGREFTAVSSIGVVVGGLDAGTARAAGGAGLAGAQDATGAPVGPGPLANADALVAAADAAMYDAKHRGGGTCVLWSLERHGAPTTPHLRGTA